MKEQFHSRIAKLLVVFALAVVASVMFVFVGCAPQEEDPAPEHTHTWETVTEDPTCGTDGYTYQECSCGEERNYRVLPATGEHEWETVTENATCTSNGYTVQVCKNCGTEGTRTSIAALGHDYEVVEEGAVAATCTAAGYHFEECTRCHDRKQISDPALGHDLVAGTPIAATCTTNGYTPYECSRCDYTEQRNVVEASGHKFGELIAYQPTDCTTDGYYYRLCSECDYREMSDRIPAIGHVIDFSATTTKITPLTCEADGKVEFVCEDCDKTLTATADQIANGDFRVENLPLSNPTVAANADPVYYYDTVNFGKSDSYPVEGPVPTNFSSNAFADTEAGRAEAAKYFLQSYGHDYAKNNKFACVDMDTTDGLYAKYEISKTNNKYNRVWNYCERCEEEFALQDHTVPAGKAPCQIDVELTRKMHRLDPDDDTNYAYECTVCKEAQPVSDHPYTICTLVSGTPTADGYDDCVFAPAEGVTTLTCEYYLVCPYCNDVKVAAPHTEPVASDEENYRTCAHGDYCTVCGTEISPKAPHNLNGHVTATNGVTFDGHAYIAPTCTTDGYTYDFCTMCAERAEDGEDVTWTENTVTDFTKNSPNGNIDSHKLNKYNHNDWDQAIVVDEDTELPDDLYEAHYYVIEVSRKGDTVPTNCLDGTYDRDICQICSEPRISVRTLYTTKTTGVGSAATTEFVAITTEQAFNAAKTANAVYTAASSTAKVDMTKDGVKLSWKTDQYGRPWTDANGNYGGRAPGEHNWALLDLGEYDASELDQIVYPVCNKRNATMLYRCTECDSDQWRTVSLEQYVIDLNELTTGEDSGLEVDDANDKIVIDGLVNTWIAAQDEAKKWHVDEMIPCGHGYCEACTDGTHNHQYSISFVIDQVGAPEGAEAVTLDTFYGWSCYTEEGDLNRLYTYIHNFDASYPAYAIVFYTDEDMTQNWGDHNGFCANIKEVVMPAVGSSDTFRDDVTYYVKATLSTSEEAQKLYFTLDGSSGKWMDDGDLHVGFQLDNSIIPYTSITKITIEILDGSSAVQAKAVSEGSKLAAYIAACQPWWPEDKSGVLAYSVDQFGYDFVDDILATNACWDVESFNLEEGKTDYIDYDLRVTIECGDDIEFIGTGAMNWDA